MSNINLMEIFIKSAKVILEDQLNLKILSIDTDASNDNICLKDFTSCINIENAVLGKFIVSVDEKVANRILKFYIGENVCEEERLIYMKDVVGEFSNTILGNSLGYFEALKEELEIGVPSVVYGRDCIECKNYPIRICSLRLGIGDIIIVFYKKLSSYK